MNVEQVIFLSLITFIAVLFVTRSVVQEVLIKEQKLLLNEYKNKIKKDEKDNSVVHKYCLNEILKKAIDIEDYETAARCKNLIQKINKYEKSNSKN